MVAQKQSHLPIFNWNNAIISVVIEIFGLENSCHRSVGFSRIVKGRQGASRAFASRDF
ncbi:MAG: hypothetical protein ACJAVK_000645 [Akkermansiaceae bacterium]|jgi:hypothetical protein